MRVVVTAKVKAVTPNSQPLVSFLRGFRDWTQYVVDEIWKLEHIPSIKELHQRFYRVLRIQGFRAHHCHKIERRAREIVKATKKNKGSKPVLKKLTARLDYQDYKLDLNSKILKIAVLNEEWVELKLQWYSYLDKYLDGSWRLREIQVSYRDGRIYVYLTFSRDVQLRESKTLMGVDINFNNITYTVVDLNGNLVSMGVIPFNGLKRALAHRIIAEKMQRRYSREWRYVRGIRESVRKHGRRARSILTDSCHYVSRRLVEVAKEYSALIVLEDLNKLRTRVNGSRKFNKKLSLWAYRRIQFYIHYKALIEGLSVAYVDPRNTSKTSPIGGKLEFINYKWVKLPTGHVVTRDLVASWNLALRGLNSLTRDVGARGHVEPLNAPDQMQSQEGMREKPVQVSKVTLVTKKITHGQPQFWKYYNGGWALRSGARWKIAENKLYLYVVFAKNVEAKRENTSKIYGVDINENNVTIYEYPAKRAVTIVTNFSKIVLGYAYRRAKIQQRWSKTYGVNGNRRIRYALRKLRERNVKRDIKLKLVRKVLDVVKDGLAVLEKLPKRFQDRVIEKNKVLNSIDVHRLKQSSIRGIHKVVIEKLAEHRIPYVLVNPSHTSSACPICGSKLSPMTGCAQRNGWKPRAMRCPRCRFTHDRDVIGAMNLVRKYLLHVEGHAVDLPKGTHDPCVEWSVTTVKCGAEVQPVLAKPTTT